jgi:hypothetical protein
MEGIDLGLGLEGDTEQEAPTTLKGKGKPAAVPKAAPVKFHRGRPEYAPPFYTINIQHVEGQPEYEVIGVNGEVLQLQRGESVPNIPEAYVNVLRQAITEKLFTRTDSEGKEHHDWKKVSAIPFSIVEGPYQERRAA